MKVNKRMDRQKMILTFLITEVCNLGCKYCYINQSPEVTTREVIDKVLDFARSRIEEDRKSVSIFLFGGECMIEESLVRYVIETSEDRFMDYLNEGLLIFKICTNATLLSKEFLHWTRSRSYVNYNFSLDGTQESNDICRVYKDGRGSYDDAIRALNDYREIYNKRADKIFYRWMVSESNAHKLYSSFLQLVEKGLKEITFSPVREGWSKEGLEIYDEQIGKIVDYMIQNKDKEIFCRELFLPVELTLLNADNRRFCSAGSNHLGISPSGVIYPCHRFYTNRFDQFILGNVFDGIDKESRWYKFFNNYTTGTFPKCSNCKTFSSPQDCKGQCIASMYESNKSLTDVIECACELSRINTLHGLRLHEAMKGTPYYERYVSKALEGE